MTPRPHWGPGRGDAPRQHAAAAQGRARGFGPGPAQPLPLTPPGAREGPGRLQRLEPRHPLTLEGRTISTTTTTLADIRTAHEAFVAAGRGAKDAAAAKDSAEGALAVTISRSRTSNSKIAEALGIKSGTTVATWRRAGLVLSLAGEECPTFGAVRKSLNRRVNAGLSEAVDAAIGASRKARESAAQCLARVEAIEVPAKAEATEEAEAPATDAALFAKALAALAQGMALPRTPDGSLALAAIFDALMADGESAEPVLVAA